VRLVTPRHVVRNKWNLRSLEQHSDITGHQIFIWDSEKTVNGKLADDRSAYELEVHRQRSRNKTSIASKLCLAVGAEVMVTVNLDTDIDLANGTRAVIQDIVLDPNEPAISADQIVNLQFLPLYLLVKLDRTRALQLPGLPPNVIPIEPFT